MKGGVHHKTSLFFSTSLQCHFTLYLLSYQLRYKIHLSYFLNIYFHQETAKGKFKQRFSTKSIDAFSFFLSKHN